MTSMVNTKALPNGSVVQWYTIHDVLGQGGFGITYLAHDENLRQLVAIKEYMPAVISTRDIDGNVVPVTPSLSDDFAWGLKRFIDEARLISKFEHPNIVSVLSVFEMNKTAYMIMRYEEGASLAEILKRNATLDEKWLKNMVLPILDGLDTVHRAGFIHRDIKPGNIYIRNDQTPVLLDFGSARQTGGVTTQTLTTLVSPGYAPFEQYYARSNKQGPWTDIYSLGATLYRATMGVPPCDAIARSEALLGGESDPYRRTTHAVNDRYGIEFLAAIDRAMSFREVERPQSALEWKRELEGDLIVLGTTESLKTTVRRVPAKALDARQSLPATHQRKYGSRVLRVAIPMASVLIIAAWVHAYLPQEADENVPGFATEYDAESFPGRSLASDADSDINRLLREAWQDLGDARFTGQGGENALARFRRVLEIDPENARALNGMAVLHHYFLTTARHAVDDGELGRAVKHARKAVATSTTDEELSNARHLVIELRRIAGR